MKLECKSTDITEAQLFLLLASIVVFITAACFLFVLGTNSTDVAEYEIIWSLAKDKNFFEVYSELRYEIGSFFLFWSLGQIFSASMTFYLVSLTSLSIKFYLFKKYLNYPLVAFTLYTLAFVYFLDANAIRIALAISIVFYALFLTPRHIYTYFFLAIVAGLLHYSGVIILILYFVRAPLLGLVLLVVFGFTFDFIVLSTDYLSFARIWISHSWDAGNVNITSSLFIMQACISFVCAIYWNGLSEGQKKGAYLNMFGVVAYLTFIDNATVAHRIRELSQIGMFSILFLGERKLTYVKLLVSIFFCYIIIYNIWNAAGRLI